MEGAARRYTRGMRDFLIFIVLASIVFFGIGEWRGWLVGVPGQTPVYVYKMNATSESTRRTINRTDFRVRVSGKVRDGSVTVRVIYQDPGSFETGRGATRPEEVFEETYRSGDTIALERVFEEGRGDYTVRLEFDGATGLFRMPMPTQAEL